MLISELMNGVRKIEAAEPTVSVTVCVIYQCVYRAQNDVLVSIQDSRQYSRSGRTTLSSSI